MSISNDISRIFKFGSQGFRRNSTVTISSLMVMTITLFLLGLLIYTNAFISYIVYGLQEKIDINVYFKPGTNEQSLSVLANSLKSDKLLKKVEFVSSDKNLEEFKSRNKDDLLVLESLNELNSNPLGPSLNIQATNPEDYDKVYEKLKGREMLGELGQSVEYINYKDNVRTIDRLLFVSNVLKKAGGIITIFFIIICILLLYNGISLGIFSKKDEIAIMKLVGAGNHMIHGPFYVEAVMFSLISTAIAMTGLYFLIGSLGQEFVDLIGGFDLFGYFMDHFFETTLTLACGGIVIGLISSWLATQKHLR